MKAATSKKSLFGYINDVCVYPNLSVISTPESLLHLCYMIVGFDILYIDATGSLVDNIRPYKRILLYTLSVRHSYGKCSINAGGSI